MAQRRHMRAELVGPSRHGHQRAPADALTQRREHGVIGDRALGAGRGVDLFGVDAVHLLALAALAMAGGLHQPVADGAHARAAARRRRRPSRSCASRGTGRPRSAPRRRRGCGPAAGHRTCPCRACARGGACRRSRSAAPRPVRRHAATGRCRPASAGPAACSRRSGDRHGKARRRRIMSASASGHARMRWAAGLSRPAAGERERTGPPRRGSRAWRGRRRCGSRPCGSPFRSGPASAAGKRRFSHRSSRWSPSPSATVTVCTPLMPQSSGPRRDPRKVP